MKFVVILHGLAIFRFEARDDEDAWQTLIDVVPVAYWEHCWLRRIEPKRKERKR